MRSIVIAFLVLISIAQAYSQCNTTLNKLLPESAVNNNDRYGSALAATQNYLVIATENSDSLGVLYGGAVFLYEKTAAGWAYRAMLYPSDPTSNDFFGNDVEIDATGNTVFVINRRYSKGVLYIFEKGNLGWETMTETHRVEFPDFFEWNATVNIKSDGTKLIIGSPGIQSPKFYVIAKPQTGWSNAVIPEIITGPPSEFGIDILLHGDYLYVSADNDDSGNGIYVYKSQGLSYQYLAKLSISTPFGSTGYFGRSLTATDDMVASTGAVYLPEGGGGYKLFIFKKNGEWTNTTETILTDFPIDSEPYRFPFPINFISPTELASAVLIKDGSSYTGKVLVTTATDNTWTQLSSNVVYEQKNLPSNSDFALNMVWNGKDLIRSVEGKNIGYTKRDAIMSLTRSGTVWGSEQKVFLPRINSSDFKFGLSVHKSGETFFVGSPYDWAAGKGAGAVYLNKKSGNKFVKEFVILPSARKLRSTGGSDAGFGYSIASNDDELAVGAPSYLYATGLYGKIFLYKKTTSTWQSAQLYDSLSAPPEFKLNHIGSALAMNDQYLFASAYNNFDNEHTNAVLIYQKVNEKWEFKQLVKLGKPINKSWPSIKFSLHNGNLMIGSSFALSAGVTVLSRNALNGMWEMKVSFGGSVFSGYGADVKFFENHFFVGAPGESFQGVARAGVVLVYAKLPEQEWNSSMEPVAIIGAKVPVEGGYFGSSIDVIGNTLAVGAPGKFLSEDNQVRTVPGNTYIIQAQDYYWQSRTEFLNLQGDRYAANERDYFGSDVGIDEDYFYIGSSSEHTESGSFSGAAYYIPSPPIIFLHPPVCEAVVSTQLQAYPPGGTWSGSGVDESGVFRPSSMGSGIYTLTYRTPNCSNEGTVKIEVKKPVLINQVTPAQVKLCSEGEHTLEVSSVGLADKYEWFYMPESTSELYSLGIAGAKKVVTNPGRYFARLNNGLCLSDSPDFFVTIENLTLTSGPQDIACASNQIVPLKISINSGTWSGPGVQNGVFNSGNLSNGFYQLSYTLISPTGCTITIKDSIEVKKIDPILITQAKADYCETGSANLLTNLTANNLTYTWYFSNSNSEPRVPIDRSLGSSAEVFEQGYYHVEASNGDCSVTSQHIQIGFESDLTYSMLPEKETELCDQSEYILSVNSRDGTLYSWFFKSEDNDSFEELNGGESQLKINESGFYKVTGEYGFCSFESSQVGITFIADSIFIPNVFTPNGDGYNQDFKVVTNTEVKSIVVVNRYGGKVFDANKNQPWNGGDLPSGIYYWHVQYMGCDGNKKERKGWVHLIR